jgi:Flp pilus assembly protein TadD
MTQTINHPERSLSPRELADLHMARQEYAEAEPLLRLLADSVPKESTEHATALLSLGQICLVQRRFGEAEQQLVLSLTILLDTVGEEDLATTVCMNNLGTLYHIIGDDARAEPLLRQVVDIRRRILGETHPRYLHSLRDLAEFHRSRNDETQATFWQRQADAVQQTLRELTSPG